ncbi:hypothetical protein ACEE60_10340, partial [Streptococcus suis]
MKQILDDFIDKVFNNSIVKGLKKKISQLTGELKRARVQLQHERSVRIAEQKEAEKKMDSLLKEVQPAMNLYEDFQNYLTENDKKKVFERIEKHKTHIVKSSATSSLITRDPEVKLSGLA